METIIAALIAAGASLLVCMISNYYQSQKIQTILQYRMDILEEKQDKYNGVIERVYRLEQNDAVHDERISMLSDALEDYRKG